MGFLRPKSTVTEAFQSLPAKGSAERWAGMAVDAAMSRHSSVIGPRRAPDPRGARIPEAH